MRILIIFIITRLCRMSLNFKGVPIKGVANFCRRSASRQYWPDMSAFIDSLNARQSRCLKLSNDSEELQGPSDQGALA